MMRNLIKERRVVPTPQLLGVLKFIVHGTTEGKSNTEQVSECNNRGGILRIFSKFVGGSNEAGVLVILEAMGIFSGSFH